MAGYLTKRRIKIFDFVKFASPFTEAIKERAQRMAEAEKLETDYVAKKNFRKEEKVEKILRERGRHAGLVWIFSALEPCTTYSSRYNPDRKRPYLTIENKKCLHYYFYFIDEELGVCYPACADLVPIPRSFADVVFANDPLRQAPLERRQRQLRGRIRRQISYPLTE